MVSAKKKIYIKTVDSDKTNLALSIVYGIKDLDVSMVFLTLTNQAQWTIYTMHNKFSNFLYFESFLFSSLCRADLFQLQ